MTRALALIDGEHYAPVVRAALEELPYDFVAAHLVGGTEKLRDDSDYGVVLADDLDAHSPSTGRSSSSISRTSRCSGRGSVSGSRAACSLPGFRTSAPTSASTRRCSSRFRFPRSGSSVPASAWGRQRSPRTPPVVRARPEGRRRRDGTRRPAEPEVATVAPDIDALLELSRAGGMRRPTTSRPLRSPASRPSAAGAAAAGSPVRSRSPTSPGCEACGRARARSRPLRRQRRGDPADRDEPPRPRRQLRDGSRRRHRVLERVPAPCLRPRRPDDGGGGLRLGGASRRRGRARAARAGDDSAPAPRRAGRGANGRVLLDRARVGARRARRSPPRGARRRRRARLRQPVRPGRCARSSSGSRPRSSSSS